MKLELKKQVKKKIDKIIIYHAQQLPINRRKK